MPITLAPESPPVLTLLTATECQKRLHVSRATFYRMIDSGEFPRPLKRNSHWARWKESDVTDFLDQLDHDRARNA